LQQGDRSLVNGGGFGRGQLPGDFVRCDLLARWLLKEEITGELAPSKSRQGFLLLP